MLDRPGFTISLRATARSDTSTCTPIRPPSTNRRLLHARTSSSPTLTRSDTRDSPFDRTGQSRAKVSLRVDAAAPIARRALTAEFVGGAPAPPGTRLALPPA